MFPYWLLFTAFAVGSVQYRPQPGRRVSGSPLLWLAGVGMMIMIGFRYEVGADWYPYLYIYQRIGWVDWESAISRGDPGFYTLLWLAQQWGLEIWVVNLVCAAIFVAGLIKFSKRQANPWLAVAVTIPYLVLVVAMSGVRQATAIGFLFFALVAFSEKKFGRFLLFVVAAASFHASSILMMGIAALSYTRSRLQSILLLAVISVPAFYLLASTFEIYVDRYSNEDLQSEGTIYRVIMNLVPAVFYLIWSNRFHAEEHEARLWKNLSYLALICFPLLFLIPSSTALDRVALYVIPLQAYVLGQLPSLFREDQGHYNMILSGVIAYLGLAMAIFLIFSSHAAFWVPYQFYPVLS